MQMDIHGLQKMTLLDFPGRVACTVFLAGCDLRCPFCHNSELIGSVTVPPVSDDAELLRFLEKRKGLLDGVVITGGEPLLRPELPDLMKRIRDLGYPVKLDTNGSHPDRLSRLIEDGLVSYVAMDIKNSPEKYVLTCGLEALELAPFRESVSLLMHGGTDYEFRTTVTAQLHDTEDIRAIGQWIAGAKRHFLQPFTDRDTVMYAGFSAPDADTLNAWRGILLETVQTVEIRGLD